MDEEVTSVRLDAEQSEVATAEGSTRQVVIAGPGAGKTQVVSALVENLVDVEGVDPVHGVLVLSFSNAAVHSVEARLRARDVPPVQIRTIDSLALRILREETDQDLAAMTFDERIRAATRILAEDEWRDADELEHLVVDEVQDLVGVRADFLLALMRALPEESGVTLLGDPAQAIYDFQLDQDSESSTTSTQLLDEARAAGARTVVLKGQYRAATRDAKAAAGLRADGVEVPHPHDVEDFWNEVVHVGDLATASEIFRDRDESTVFLTSTNGQALAVAGALRETDMRVTVSRGAQHQLWDRWIAQVLGDVATPSVERDEFLSLMSERAPRIDAAAGWRALKSVAGGRGRSLDLISLVSGLQQRYSALPDLIDTPRTQAVVSTVHRAKGLEFDNVALVDFPEHGRSEGSEDAVGRERFVALTRARRLLVRVDGPDIRWVRLAHCGGEAGPRWIRGGPKPWMTTAFEVRASDLDTESLASDPEVRSGLAKHDPTGATVQLLPSPERSTLVTPIFEVRWHGVLLGHTTAFFGAEFATRTGTLERARRSWPALHDVHVESVATMVGDPHLSDRRLFLAPVMSGLARIEWRE